MSNKPLARPEIVPCGRACPAETTRIQPSLVHAVVAWSKRRLEAKRAHLSSLNRHTPNDMGFDAADHNRNWPQLLDTIPGDIVMEALREKCCHGQVALATSTLNDLKEEIMESWLTVFFLIGNSWVPGDQLDGWASRRYADGKACSDRRQFAENYTRRYPFDVDSKWICNVGGPATKAPAFEQDALLTLQAEDW